MSNGHLFVLGATHHTAPLAVRERLSVAADTAAALQTELSALAGLREVYGLNAKINGRLDAKPVARLVKDGKKLKSTPRSRS